MTFRSQESFLRTGNGLRCVQTQSGPNSGHSAGIDGSKLNVEKRFVDRQGCRVRLLMMPIAHS